jgi:predicted dehydrogenase
MKVLIVGMGFGNLYKAVHKELGHEVVTVDTNGSAAYTNVDDALRVHTKFDVVHICTPNFTHVKLARKVAFNSKIVIVEKPGAANALAWKQLVDDYPKTRFMMSKNNMWRDNIVDMQIAAAASDKIEITWVNKDRVPNPGSWFTNKSLAYGGVSRDLMPHLLSLYIALNPEWVHTPITNNSMGQVWSLEDLSNSDYGSVDPNGVYDVDDHATVWFDNRWILHANWRDDNADDRSVKFDKQEFELGLCPESAYKAMIVDAINNKDNDEFWATQYSQDIWIHTIIDTLWK